MRLTMRIQATSIIARHEIVADGTVDSQADRVYDLIAREPMTIREIAEELKMWPGTVSARIADLRKDGRVMDGEHCHTRKCRVSDRAAIAWEVKEREPQIDMFKS